MNKNFRRYLKNLVKNCQRTKDYSFVEAELKRFGLYGTFGWLCWCLKRGKAKGRHFNRLGKAALSQGKLVRIFDITWYTETNKDLREIPFRESVI